MFPGVAVSSLLYGPLPTPLTASTWYEYAVPLVTVVSAYVVPLETVASAALGYFVALASLRQILYRRIVDPPSLEGGCQLRYTTPSPAVPLSTGAPGTDVDAVSIHMAKCCCATPPALVKSPPR